MGARADDAATRSERARMIGLFRYRLIREAADPGLSTRARGRLVRAVAAAEHLDPTGRQVRVSRDTLDRWIRAWRRGGFDALVPSPRQSAPRLPVEVVEIAVALKRENLDRSAAQVRRILATQMGWAPGERTLQRWFADDPTITDLVTAAATAAGAGTAFGRFEALRPNELWTGDALHGPTVAGRKTYLFAFLDDHSRAIMGHRFGFAEDTVRLAAALRPALGSRGIPDGIYVDNGSAFVDAWLLRACAKLGIRLIHSTPGRPQGRGKIERYFRTVREQFLVEITGDPADPSRHPVADLGELNRLFTAWVETVYHRSVHSETGQPPLARWQAAGPFPLPSTEALAEAFLWEEQRTVTKTALVSLQGNTYQVDPLLVGRRVELVFDPFDLTRIQVRLRGVPAGTAIPHRIGRHAHLKARPETPPELPAPTGIDYAHLIAEIHQTQLGTPGTGVNYAALAGSTPAGSTPAGSTPAGSTPAGSTPAGSNTPASSNDQLPGQLDLLTDGATADGGVVS
jgi:putative transposase